MPIRLWFIHSDISTTTVVTLICRHAIQDVNSADVRTGQRLRCERTGTNPDVLQLHVCCNVETNVCITRQRQHNPDDSICTYLRIF